MIQSSVIKLAILKVRVPGHTTGWTRETRYPLSSGDVVIVVHTLYTESACACTVQGHIGGY